MHLNLLNLTLSYILSHFATLSFSGESLVLFPFGRRLAGRILAEKEVHLFTDSLWLGCLCGGNALSAGV